MIAHRLSTIKKADIGFTAGKVKEMDNHETLLKKENGIYANPCNMQTFDNTISTVTKRHKEKGKESVEQVAKTDEVAEEELPAISWGAILGMNPRILYRLWFVLFFHCQFSSAIFCHYIFRIWSARKT